MIFGLFIVGISYSTLVQTILNGELAPAHPKATIYYTEVRTIHSSIAGDDYEITIALPKDYQSSNTTYE